MFGRGDSSFAGDASMVDSSRQTLSELVLEIEEASRQKPKQKTVVKNFARENIIRLREKQKLCREAQQATSQVSPFKGLYRPMTGLAGGVSSQVPSCTQRSKLRSGKVDSTDPGVPFQFVPKTKYQTDNNLNVDPNTFVGEATDTALVKDARLRDQSSNRQNIPKLPIDGASRDKTELKTDTGKLKDVKIKIPPKFLSSQKLVRTSSAPSLASAQTSISRTGRQLPETYCYGSVPKYLVDRKKQWDREAIAKKKQEECEQSAPPGHELIPEEKRIETLEQLDGKYNELLKKMTALPMRMDTLRVCELRKELEKQLVKVEEAIKIFSQPKVFLKKDV